MNKNIALALSCAVAVLGLVSCNNKEADLQSSKGKTHTVVFKAQTPAAQETKTSLRLEVVPDWRKTDVDDVHIFETETTSSGIYRTESDLVKMETPIGDNWSLARFSAAFDNMKAIVVTPTKAESTPGYKYTAIMASTLTEGDVVKYIVPSEQYPDDEAWIDPKADMLVGSDGTTYSHYLEEDDEIDLSFKRPVALARLAITNLEGTKVSKVKLSTANYITGYVTYDEINFNDNTIAAFNGDESNKELTILYPEGKKKTTTFYAYFVCVPGTIQFNKIEVYTDQYVFTKAYATPASLTLTAGDFMNIALDMTPKDNNGVTRTGLGEQTLTFVDDDENAVTAIEFDLVNGKDKFVAPTLVIGDNVVDKTAVTITSNNEEVATVDDEGKVSLTGATGEVTITAAVPGDETHAAGYASYTITVTDTTTPVVEETTYTLVTKQEDVVEGKYLIVNAADAYVFDGTGTYQGGYATIAEAENIALDSDAKTITITGETDAFDFAFAKSGDGFTITGEKGMIVAAAHDGASTSEETYITFAETGGSVFLQRGSLDNKPEALLFSTTRGTSSEEYWYYHTTNDIFKIGGSGKSNGIHLYFAGERAAQTISFSKTEDTYDMASADAYVAPTLSSEPKTQVNYSSSNTTVATVDANGAVTIKGKGETTITAFAVATSEYLSATASFTLTVTNSAAKDLVYNKVTSVDDLDVDGQYLLVFEGLEGDTDGDGDPKVLNPVLDSENNSKFAKAQTSALDVTISNGTIKSSDFEGCQFTLEEGYYLKANKANNYIYPAYISSKYEMGAEATASQKLTISFDNGIAVIANSSRYLVWSTSSHYFSCNNAVSGQYSTGICLYKLDDGRQTPTMSFSPTTAEIDLANVSSFTKPSLTYTGDATSVTYTSSDTDVAEVSNDGTITPKKKGTVTITAKAARTDTYKAASASYTLTVVNTSEVPSVYNKVTSTADLTSGSKVIVVYEGNNTYNPAVFVPILNGDYFTQKDKKNAKTVTITNNSITSADLDDCQMTVSGEYYFYVSSASRYLYPTYNNIGAEADKGSSHAVSVTITDGVAKLSRVSNNTTYYIRYSGSNLYFENTNSTSNSANVALYLLDDGKPKSRNLAFSESAVSVNIYGQTLPYAFAGAPTLSGKTDGVTYSVTCSDTQIEESAYPTVSSTGAVTINGTGVFTITASGAETETLQAGEASYTLTVTSVAPSTYTKVSAITSGATYLIVAADANNYNNNGQKKAFAGDTSGTAIDVDGTSGTITGYFESYEFVITAEDNAYTLKGPNGYVTGQSTSDPYIQVSSSKVTMSLTDAATLSSENSGDGLVSDAFYFYYLKSNSKEALYLNSNGKFKNGGSGRKYGVYLYKKNVTE